MKRVSKQIMDKLLNLPETGMGYQIIECETKNGEKSRYIVINASDAFEINSKIGFVDFFDECAITLEDTTANISNFQQEHKDNKLEVTPDAKIMLYQYNTPQNVLKGANEAMIEYTKIGEEFVRFSPFEDDKRVDKVNKRLLPGTFVTTKSDAEYCLNNKFDPRDRYALPSILPVQFAFFINPTENTPIKRGIVQPAYEKQGGGEEAIFTEGTTNGTLVNIKTL